MKKHRDANELAARITAAARQPAGMRTAPAPVVAAPISEVQMLASPAAPPRRKKTKAKAVELDTVPITLRPDSVLLNRYVLKASERTREEGRVISAQHIMLEVLQRSDV